MTPSCVPPSNASPPRINTIADTLGRLIARCSRQLPAGSLSQCIQGYRRSRNAPFDQTQSRTPILGNATAILSFEQASATGDFAVAPPVGAGGLTIIAQCQRPFAWKTFRSQGRNTVKARTILPESTCPTLRSHPAQPRLCRLPSTGRSLWASRASILRLRNVSPRSRYERMIQHL
jgi:hypothetical protein